MRLCCITNTFFFDYEIYHGIFQCNLGIANGVFYCHVQHQCWIYVLGLKKLVGILRSKQVGFMIFIVFQFSPICAKGLFQQKFYFKRIFQNKALNLTFQNSIITIWLRFKKNKKSHLNLLFHSLTHN